MFQMIQILLKDQYIKFFLRFQVDFLTINFVLSNRT